MKTGEKERRELKVTSYLGNTASNPMTISLGEYIYAFLLVFKYYFVGLCKVYSKNPHKRTSGLRTLRLKFGQQVPYT